MIKDPLRLAVIVGSTREGRIGPTVARWFVDHASQRDDVDVVTPADASVAAEPAPALATVGD